MPPLDLSSALRAPRDVEVRREPLRLVDVERRGPCLEGLVRPGHADAPGAYRLDLLGPGVHERDLVPGPGEEAAEIAADRACADEEESWAHGTHDIRLRSPNATAIIGRRCPPT